ncbi:MAG: hypothetical protein AVDCRST_MAG59-3402, partial [uncultured Thermomicrobiales bacterium]
PRLARRACRADGRARSAGPGRMQV